MTPIGESSHPARNGLSRRTLLQGGLTGGLVVLGLGALGWSRGDGAPLVRVTAPMMGSTAEVLVERAGPDGRALARASLEAMREVERRMTRFDAASEIGRVNAAPGHDSPVSPMTASVVAAALAAAGESQGRFDPGLGRLEARWGFYDAAQGQMPARPIGITGFNGEDAPYRRIRLKRTDGRPLLGVAGPDVQLDLGGIAKGFAVDRAVQVLREGGLRHALVNVGGDLYALGCHPSGRPWQVGVRHPRRERTYLTVLSLRERGVATSGDYENFFMAGGQRYHHLLEPRTGAPAPYHQSVTVTAASVMEADALATAAFTTPPDEARAFLDRMGVGRWLTVDAKGRAAWG